MKYMEVPELASLSRHLHHHSAECAVHARVEAYSCKSINKDKKLFASLEQSYLEDVAASSSRSLPSEMAIAPTDDSTPFGSLASPSARKTLYLLIATLNIAFPDYSFSTLRPDSFVREPSGAHILSALSSALISQSARPNSLGISPPRSYASYPHLPSTELPSSSASIPSSSPSFLHRSFLHHKSLLNASSDPDSYSTVHPTLYKTLEDVIKLSECEVFSYSPDPISDPHAGDSDDEQFTSDDDSAFSDEEFDPVLNQPSEEEEDYTFVFDEDTVSDELISVSVSPPKSRWVQDPPRKRHDSSDFSALSCSEHAHPRRSSVRHRRPRTPLLWSSNWFFYNRKLKRIVFISIWARKSWSSTLADFEGEDATRFSSSATGDSFKGWVGDVGAGARALGLVAKSL